jgi:2-dehydropantoate 2-reductase
MKYLIIGTGGIGGSLGAFLARSGKDVTFIARGEHLKQMKQNGLLVSSGLFGDFVIRNVDAATEEEYNEKADVIFVCVKGYALEGIVGLLKKSSHDSTIIIPLLNGLNIGNKLEKMIGQDITILDGCLYLSGYIESPGKIVQTGKNNKIIFGVRKGKSANMEILKRVQNDLNDSGMNALLSDNIACDIYKKFACNASFGVCGAYYDITTKKMQQKGIYRDTAVELLNELSALATAQDVIFDEDLTEASLKFIDGLVVDTTSSLQRDLQENRKSEIDALLFDVVRQCRILDVHAPEFEKIAAYFGFEQ